MKGLVVEKQAHCTIVLTPSGEYKKIRRCVKEEIGQEVTVSPCFAVPKAAVMAAGLAIVLLLSQAMPVMLRGNDAYAYITLDINPSAEFAIDADDIVLSAHPFNQAAEEILTGMEYRGKEIGPVLADFTQSAISRQYIGSGSEGYVVVSYYSEHTKDEMTAKAKLMRLIEAPQQVLKSSGQEIDINTVIVDAKTRREARRLGISAGRLEEMKRENKMDKDSPDESVPAGNAEKKKSSSNQKSPNQKSSRHKLLSQRNNTLKAASLKAEKSSLNRKESSIQEQSNYRRKLETKSKTLEANFRFRQVRSKEAEKPYRKDNGNRAGLNESKSEFISIHRGAGSGSKEVKQKEAKKERQYNAWNKDKDKNKNKKANTRASKGKANTKNKDRQKSGQSKKPVPVTRA